PAKPIERNQHERRLGGGSAEASSKRERQQYPEGSSDHFRSTAIVAPHEPLVSSPERNVATNGERRSNACTVVRKVPVPFPCTMRTSRNPLAAHSARYAGISSPTSFGRKV